MSFKPDFRLLFILSLSPALNSFEYTKAKFYILHKNETNTGTLMSIKIP